MKDERTACRRCGIEFEPNNPAVNCGTCDGFTLCLACAEGHACCLSDDELRKRNDADEALSGAELS